MDNKNYKTVICKYYDPSRGKVCSYGSECTFIHSDPHSNTSTTDNLDQMNKKYYKTRICKYYNPSKGEGCSNGSKCTFIHSDPHSDTSTTDNIDPSRREDNHNYLKENPIIVLIAEIINGYPVFGKYNGKIIGINVPTQHLFQGCSSENYVTILNYLTEKGYEIISLINYKEEKIIVHLKNTTTHHFSSSENWCDEK